MVRLRARPKPWDRFARLAPGAALLVAALAVAMLVAAVLTARPVGDAPAAPAAPAATAPAAPVSAGSGRDTDLALYDRIAARVGAGENYYEVAVEEQRARGFPVRPGLAVRLPTLAVLSGWAGPGGMVVLAALLGLAVIAAWWWRLEEEPGGPTLRTIILLLLVTGAASGFKPYYLALHEVWSGMLLALALALHRPGRWRAAWLAAALALAFRELALPFVLLVGALALWRGQRVEAMAWAVLVLLFGVGLAVHLGQVGAVTSAADAPSPSWLALRGLGGWTGNIAAASLLQWLPAPLAAPLALLPVLGWAAWRSDLGATGFLLCTGYGIAFTIAGRDNNFYWALMVMPVWFIGLAFLPRGLASLWYSARGL